MSTGINSAFGVGSLFSMPIDHSTQGKVPATRLVADAVADCAANSPQSSTSSAGFHLPLAEQEFPELGSKSNQQVPATLCKIWETVGGVQSALSAQPYKPSSHQRTSTQGINK